MQAAPRRTKGRAPARVAPADRDNVRSKETKDRMAKKPNYRADRIERERAKATKKAKRLEARTGKSGKSLSEEAPREDTLAVDRTIEDRIAEPSDGDERGDADPS